ncbi:MAG: recombinase family protein [bacterium]
MKYFLYCRKSQESEDRQSLSLPAQVTEMSEYARNNSLNIVHVYIESKSARFPNKRLLFSEMIGKIQNGEADAILCYHTNRLSRNPEEAGKIMQMISDGIIKEIRTANETISWENANDILLGVQFGTNSQFSKDLSRVTKRGTREKIRRGEWPTLAPLFYINYEDKGVKNIKPDPSNSQVYSNWIDKVIYQKLNIPEAVSLLNELGVRSRKGKMLANSTVHEVLRNPIYCGMIKYKDYEVTKGTFPALISEEKWNELQIVLNDRTKPNKSKWNHKYKRIMRCGKCGLMVTGYTKVKKSGKAYTYYSCTKRNGDCGNPPITEDKLEKQVLDNLSKIELNRTIIDSLKTLIIEKLDKESSFEVQKRKSIESSILMNSNKLDRLLHMRMDNELTIDEYASEKKKILEENVKLEESRSAVVYNRTSLRNQLELFFESCLEIGKLFTNGTIEEKRAIIYEVTESISLEDEKLRWNFKKPYQSLIMIKNSPNQEEWGS